MGQLKGDGKATNVTVAAGIWGFGDLTRMESMNGILMDDFVAADVERDSALEISERIWYVPIPAAVVAAKGALLYWAVAGSEAAGYHGNTDLSATINGAPCVIVEEAVDANDICGVRVLNHGLPAT